MAKGVIYNLYIHIGTLIRTLTGHTSFITYLALLQDGTIASASWYIFILYYNNYNYKINYYY